MRKLFVFLGLIALLSCTKTVYLTEEKEVEVKEYVTLRDTIIVPRVRVDTLIQYREIPDTSRLENKYSASEAWVVKDSIHHTLWLKPFNFKFDIKIPQLHKDSIIRIREPYPVEVIKEVRHIPTFFWICFGVIVLEIIGFFVYLWLKTKF